ncbi:hypothetical protein GCM10007863_30980 [Dyella mobilis]|nr:hypothetical protein GCM10007863_30980 [Dyella mobilis]
MRHFRKSLGVARHWQGDACPSARKCRALAIRGVMEATDYWPDAWLSREPARARKSRGGMSYARRNA